MFWTEDEEPAAFAVPDDVVDLLFAIDCRELPVDHAYALSQALCDALPWLAQDARVAVHEIHVAGSQNGWERPARDAASRLQLSRRTRLQLRAPQDAAVRLLAELPGTLLDIAGCRLAVGAGKTRPLSAETTLFARHVAGAEEDERSFLARCARELAALEIRMSKALCGKTTHMAVGGAGMQTRSLLLADLSAAESVRLQQHGLGPHRLLGCGIFIPHKGIKAIGAPR